MDTYGALVIILATMLGIFLVLAIIASIMLIVFLRKIKNVPEHIEKAAKNVENVTAAVTKTATPLILLSRLIDKLGNKNK